MKERITLEKMPEVKTKNSIHIIRYVNFINSRPERELRQKGFETHHIYPKSLAKKNNIEDCDGDWNLIELTPREHFIAHLILWKCGYKEMIYAFWYISNNYNKISSRIYEKIKKEFIKFKIKDNKERFWINNGVEEKFIKQEELKQFKDFKIGRLKKEFYKKRNYLKKVWVFKGDKECQCDHDMVDDFLNVGYLFGRTPFNKERCKKMSDGKIGMVRINKNGEIKTVYKNKLEEYLNNGWFLGSNLSTTKNNVRMSFNEKVYYINVDKVEHYKNLGFVIGYNDSTRRQNKRIKRILCIENGIVYETKKDATNNFKGIICGRLITRSINENKTIKGYTFKYID